MTLTVLALNKSGVYKDFNRAGKMTYDLSLPLCRSNSRFPLESKPSLRPMPRPLPPRPPLPPPRPLIGLSPMGLKRRRVNLSNPHQSTDLSAWLSEVDSQDKQLKRFTKDYWEKITLNNRYYQRDPLRFKGRIFFTRLFSLAFNTLYTTLHRSGTNRATGGHGS